MLLLCLAVLLVMAFSWWPSRAVGGSRREAAEQDLPAGTQVKAQELAKGADADSAGEGDPVPASVGTSGETGEPQEREQGAEQGKRQQKPGKSPQGNDRVKVDEAAVNSAPAQGGEAGGTHRPTPQHAGAQSPAPPKDLAGEQETLDSSQRRRRGTHSGQQKSTQPRTEIIVPGSSRDPEDTYMKRSAWWRKQDQPGEQPQAQGSGEAGAHQPEVKRRPDGPHRKPR